MFRSAPPPIVASVVTLESVIATDGTTATSPPAAPVFACVAIASDVVAAMVTLCPPFSVPISSARVTSSTSATATDAPIPTDPAVTPDAPPELSAGASAGVASVAPVMCEVAVMFTSPVGPAVSVPNSSASVWMLTMSIATEPAMLTDPPPAPLFADAPTSCVEPMTAAIVAPFVAVTTAFVGRIAWLWICASLIATAAPIETPPPLPSLLAPLLPLPLESLGGWTALPSAAACASVSADVASVKRPPAWIVTLSATVASDVVVARLMPTAAATDTPPSDVDAEGVPVPPVPWPPLLVEVVSAKPRCCATWSSTPLPLAPPDDSPGAPAADACALAELSDEPSALIVTSPPAVRSRSRVAVLL